MTALTARELTSMRIVSDDFLPDTCSIWTNDATDPVDSIGAPDLTASNFTETYTGVACRVDPGSGPGGGNEAIAADTPEVGLMFMLNIPYYQPITVEDRIVHSGKTYEVQSVADTHSYATIRRAVMKRVN